MQSGIVRGGVSIMCLTVMGIASQSATAAIYAKFDFGPSGGTTTAVGGANYTNLTDISTASTVNILNYTSGTPGATITGATAKVSTNFNGTLSSSLTAAGTVASTFATNATKDGFYTTSGNAAVTFSGLSVANKYTFTIYGAVATSNRAGSYTVTGDPTTTETSTLTNTGNTSNVLTIADILPLKALPTSTTGTITLSIALTGGSGAAYLNALEIDTSPAPEPASAMILAASSGVAFLRRRRVAASSHV